MGVGTDAARLEQARALEEARSRLARVERELERAHNQPGAPATDALIAEIDAFAGAVYRLRESVRPSPPGRGSGIFENLWRTFFGP